MVKKRGGNRNRNTESLLINLIIITAPFVLCTIPAYVIIHCEGKQSSLLMATSTRPCVSIVDSYFWIIVYSDVIVTLFP